ncbi:MAG: endolytic transglycosylase MltG [Gemmatimonadota bacterium]
MRNEPAARPRPVHGEHGRPRDRTRRLLVLLGLGLGLGSGLGGCGGEGSGPVVRVRVPVGASFSAVVDSLVENRIVDSAVLFKAYARVTGATDEIQAGTYGFRRGAGWGRILEDLREGNVMTIRVVIPEGWNLRRIAARLADVTDASEAFIIEKLTDSATVARFGVPGPTLEGYLYPATYVWPADAPLDLAIERMVGRYRRIWTPARRATADSVGMSEREVVTLASIVETEAKVADEMPVIAAVFHNRLRIGYRLQADPTVQYALGEHQTRLLYPHIEEVADHPYNTYTHGGLPPGPIASPSVRAIDAVLAPADVDYLYFVARPDGSHIFTRSLEAHNRARRRVEALRRAGESGAAATDAGTN